MRLRPEQITTLAQDHAARALADAFAPLHHTVEPSSKPNVVALRDPEGSVGLVELDQHARISAYRYPSGRQLRMEYSDDNRLTELELPSGLSVSLAYDDSARPVLIDREGLQWRLQYNAEDVISAASYPSQVGERIETDDQGDLVAHTDRNGRTTLFKRDASRRLIELVDANGSATTFQYGIWDRPDSLVRPDGVVEQVVRDGAGMPSEVLIDGELVASTNFQDGRLSEVRYADGECLSFTYDEKSRVTEARAGETMVKRAFDDEGRLIREEIDDQVVELEYTFDGRLATITTAQGRVRYQYDGDRRLVLVEDWLGGQQHYSYRDPDRGVVRSLPGLKEETTFTPVGLVSQVVTSAGDVPRMWQQYAHDEHDRVVSVNDSHVGQTSYAYDAEGQLLAAVGRDSAERFAYDSVGNRIAANALSASVNGANQLVAAGGERMLYDRRGNLVSREGMTGTTRYVFSTRNLLKTVELADGTKIEFAYDAFGRRCSKRVGDKVTRYMWSGSHMIYEWIEGKPDSHSEYLYKPETHEPLAMRQNRAVFYFHNGHDGAPRRLTDASGGMVWMAYYGVFGDLLHSEGSAHQPLRFAGQYADEETGLYYNLARYYAPDHGRYISRDPLDFAAGPNAYLYCYNDPLGGRDPTGLLSGFWKVAASAALITVGVVAVAFALPVVLGATAVTATVVATAGLVVAGGAAVGAGIRLGLAPDGCLACQRRAMIEGAIQGASIALALMTMMACPPAGMAFAAGGTTAGAATIAAGAAAVAAAVVAMSGSSSGGGGDGAEDDPPPKKKLKAKDRRKAEQEKAQEAKGKTEGTPGNNQAQNKEFKDAARGLSDDQKQQLHHAITKQNMTREEIIAERNAMFPENPY